MPLTLESLPVPRIELRAFEGQKTHLEIISNWYLASYNSQCPFIAGDAFSQVTTLSPLTSFSPPQRPPSHGGPP